MKTKSIFVSILFLYGIVVMSQTPAFPTAEGYGKWATGGRGGKVVEVTNLLDDGVGAIPGSLRWALKQYSGSPLTVVFRVSGIIDLKGKELRSMRSNVTIAGQTAPGDGICIKGHGINLGGSFNVIVRHLRFRTGAYTPDSVEVNAASIRLENGGNFIFDHCSAAWSPEELCDFSDDDDLTVQWCIFTEALYSSVNSKGARGYGPVIAGERASYHHNLLANNVSRSPRFGVSSKNDVNVLVDFVNNVNYNYGKSNACYGGENEMGTKGSVKINFVNNYYKQGPAYPNNRTSLFVRASYEAGITANAYTKWHLSGNFIEGTTNQALNTDNYAGLDISEMVSGAATMGFVCTKDDVKSDHHSITEPVFTETAQDAFNSVLSKAGAYPLDVVDVRAVTEARTGIASKHGRWNNYSMSGIIDTPWDAGGWPVYQTYNTVADNDHDGMDDAWETSNGLNPVDAEDRNLKTPEGYTALEVYLNSLVGENIAHNFFSGLDDLQLFDVNIIPYDDFGNYNIVSNKQLKSAYIYNADGKMLMELSLQKSNIINISNFKYGVYFVKLFTENKTSREFKIVKYK